MEMSKMARGEASKKAFLDSIEDEIKETIMMYHK